MRFLDGTQVQILPHASRRERQWQANHGPLYLSATLRKLGYLPGKVLLRDDKDIWHGWIDASMIGVLDER